MPKTPEYLKPPGYQVDADKFVCAVESTIIPQYNNLFITTYNTTKEFVDFPRAAKEFEHLIGRPTEASLRTSDVADQQSAFLNEVAVHIAGNDKLEIRSARTEVDRLARIHLGEKDTETGQIEEDEEALGESMYDSKWDSHNYYVFSFRS